MSQPMSGRMLEIARQLAADRNALLASIAGLEGSQYGYREGEGRWSISEVLEHLALAHESMEKAVLHLGRKAEQKGVVCVDDSSVLDRIDRRQLAEPRQKAQAPDFVLPGTGMPVAESLSRLEGSRARVLDLLPGLSRYELSTFKLPHPLLGVLDAYQWIIMLGVHEVRHAVQIRNIRESPGFPE